MKSSLLLGLAAAALCHAEATAQQSAATNAPVPASAPSAQPYIAPEGRSTGIRTGTPLRLSSAAAEELNLRNGAIFTGLSGYWDYQSNGMMRGRMFIPQNDPQKVYLATMTASDGTDETTINATRHSGYAYSNDGGATWNAVNSITDLRLGYPYIQVSAEGVPYIATHGDPDGAGIRTIMYTGSANSTAFTKSGEFERVSITGRTGDAGAGVIWPAFVISPKDPTKQVLIATLSVATQPVVEDPDPVHVAVSPLGGRADWSYISDETFGTSGGGRNVMGISPAGKIGVAYFHSDAEGGSGIYFSESTDGGTTWSMPVRAVSRATYINTDGGGLNDDQDTIYAGLTLDFVYNGEQPQIVTSGSTNGLYVSQSIYFWNGTGDIKRIAGADSTRGIGLIRAVPTSAQPNMDYVDYPQLSVGDDGQHIVVVFQAAAQTTSEVDEETGRNGDAVTSEDGFYYNRLWAVGSANGGASWEEPILIQDFAGEGSDSATIEYPTTSGFGKVTDNSFELSVAYQAKRFPGMYTSVVTDVDPNTEGDQPATTGPISQTGMYFQRMTLDPTFFGQPASVDNQTASNAGMMITRSYPNPASGKLTVEFTLPGAGEMTLKVYNSLGQEMIAPIAGEHGYAGDYRKDIDVSALQAGAYRLVLTQNGRTISQPLSIVR